MEINNLNDLYNMLDQFAEGIHWDTFYSERNKPAPFLINNTLPDKCVVEFINNFNVKRAIEFGCGEGRNAIYLAENGVKVDAYDLSEVAIKNAEHIMRNKDLDCVSFSAKNIFNCSFSSESYDLVLDCGLFHHLAPHRRLQYKHMVHTTLEKGGYFLLYCFAAGGNGGDEVDDYEFYHSRLTGVAFSEDRLRSFWETGFECIFIHNCEQVNTDIFTENEYMYKCLFHKI